MSRRITRTYAKKHRGPAAIASSKKKGKKDQDFDIWLEENDPDFVPPDAPGLEPEHSSVESIDPDDDDDDEDEDAEFGPTSPRKVHAKRTRSKRLAKRGDDGKGKEEADDASPDLVELGSDWRPKRQRRRRPFHSVGPLPEIFGDEDEDDDDGVVLVPQRQDDEGYILSPASDDDDAIYEAPQADEPRTEVVTLDEATRIATVNIALLNALVGAGTYLSKKAEGWAEQRMRQIDSHIEATLNALHDCPLPITQAAPVERVVPPTIPFADGTEMRFTNVAQSLGINWRDVPEEEKRKVYARASNLHHDHYGCYPVERLMYTGTGLGPVNYYNEITYRPTMLRALQEFKRQQHAEAAIAAGLHPAK
jgi:hypothetical protein